MTAAGTDTTHTDLIEDKSMNNWFRKSPIQRQRWGDKQLMPHVNWGDLFFDLFYVAAAYNLAYIIKDDPSLVSLLYFFGCFGPITAIWHQKTMYDARFQDPIDIFHVLLEIVQLSFLAFAVLHIRPVYYMSQVSKHPEMFVYCLSIWFNILYSIFKEGEIRFWGVVGQSSAPYAAMTQILWNIPSFCVVTAATVYSGVVYFSKDNTTRFLAAATDDHATTDDASATEKADHVPIILLCCAWVVRQSLLYPVFYFRSMGDDFKKYQVPINVEFVIHRYGEWTMLMLGESILSLLIVDISDETITFYTSFFMGILSVIFLQYLYFKSQPHHAEEHALRHSRLSGIIHGILMSIYSGSLIIVGVSYKMILTEYTYMSSYQSSAYVSTSGRRSLFMSDRDLASSSSSAYTMEERRQRMSNFFCYGLATVFLCLDLMTLVHKGIKASMNRCHCAKMGRLRYEGLVAVVGFRLGGIVFTASACSYVTEPGSVAVVGLGSIIFQVLIRLYGSVFFPGDEEHEDHGGHDHHGKEINKEDIDDVEDYNDNHWPNVTQPVTSNSDQA